MYDLLLIAGAFAVLIVAFSATMLAHGVACGMRYRSGAGWMRSVLIPLALTAGYCVAAVYLAYSLNVPAPNISANNIGFVPAFALLLHGIGIYVGGLTREHKFLLVNEDERGDLVVAHGSAFGVPRIVEEAP